MDRAAEQGLLFLWIVRVPLSALPLPVNRRGRGSYAYCGTHVGSFAAVVDVAVFVAGLAAVEGSVACPSLSGSSECVKRNLGHVLWAERNQRSSSRSEC